MMYVGTGCSVDVIVPPDFKKKQFLPTKPALCLQKMKEIYWFLETKEKAGIFFFFFLLKHERDFTGLGFAGFGAIIRIRILGFGPFRIRVIGIRVPS